MDDKRRWFLLLLLLGVGLILIWMNLLDTLEREAACTVFGNRDACCSKGRVCLPTGVGAVTSGALIGTRHPS